MKRLLKGRVFLNGEEISTDVRGLDIRVRPDEVLTCTVELFVNDITKDKDGGIIYWLGTQPQYIEGGQAGCPMDGCKIREPHLHTKAEMAMAYIEGRDDCE